MRRARLDLLVTIRLRWAMMLGIRSLGAHGQPQSNFVVGPYTFRSRLICIFATWFFNSGSGGTYGLMSMLDLESPCPAQLAEMMMTIRILGFVPTAPWRICTF